MAAFKQRLVRILIDELKVDEEQLNKLADEAKRQSKDLPKLLIERQLVTEQQLAELVAKEMGLPLISLPRYQIDRQIARLIPERIARQYMAVALSKLEENIVIAIADPFNVIALDDLKALTQANIQPVVALESEIRQSIERIYSPDSEDLSQHDLSSAEGEDKSLSDEVEVLLDGDGDDEAPVVRAINLIVVEGIRRKASDIHLEPTEEGVRVRFRIDGKLTEAHRIPKAMQGPLVTRLKIMSGLDITEWRVPQDGRFKAVWEGHEVDFRVSILPITHGGKVVLRILDKSSLTLGMETLGFLKHTETLIIDAIHKPYGMMLVTGPTGSGKSTTLYSVLNLLNEPKRNLVTIEDPVEYQVEGITQVQANPDVGLSFSNGLRALLRQSPDVVMIGEIRDFETADIAMKSSLTGQLVLSTLHTNDAPSAVTRLIDMGVEPFLVASSVNLIEAQRLVRKLCEKCKDRQEPNKELFEKIGMEPEKEGTYFRAVGCNACGGKGFRGRMCIVEVCVIDDVVRDLIVTRAQSWEIKKHAQKHLGMKTLREDGLIKAAMGHTTVEEVVSATSEE